MLCQINELSLLISISPKLEYLNVSTRAYTVESIPFVSSLTLKYVRLAAIYGLTYDTLTLMLEKMPDLLKLELVSGCDDQRMVDREKVKQLCRSLCPKLVSIKLKLEIIVHYEEGSFLAQLQ
ncbi:unnamed protein product [Didymodactylos carnosus]|uniref:Uncharacterized protein n=1 Tax=Didymodactylos carnosus TaxID=1234261 RepID=A0A814XJX2_9BILA|nr:unnamed protein product [Didymodactylos carnosus]CAF1217793.1 unnamed protein product [Didymodactylos carnosus]CAF3745684.1 unnamed protein product [Didymodactylos carnosus]CAF3981395.1 unnamed protein product [Didymodactylos carnosus]